MIRVLDIALKDLLQIVRDRNTFVFLLFMPIVFTLLFGFASGGFSRDGGDSRLGVGFLDEDDSATSRQLRELMEQSEVIRLVSPLMNSRNELEQRVADEKLVAAVIVPEGYGHDMLNGKSSRLDYIGDNSSTSGMSIESEVLTSVIHLQSAINIATVFEEETGDATSFDYVLKEALSRWESPPIEVIETTSSAIQTENKNLEALAHTSPAMMLQFGICGLLAASMVIVSERRTRTLQRLLTTNTARMQILVGHFIAIFALIFIQFILLLSFGQIFLQVNYLRDPLSVLTVAFCAALCIGAMGTFVGVIARDEEQAVTLSLVPMFVLSIMGGAWVPLEVTGKSFQAIGHLSPVAWGMDGFKNITIRGLGFESVIAPSLALLGYAVVFFMLAAWKFRTE